MQYIPYFENYENLQYFKIRKYQISDRKAVMRLCVDAFSYVIDASEIPDYIDSVVNYDISFVVVNKDTDIVAGVYLLGDKQLSEVIEYEEADTIYADLGDYENLHGVEGIALVVDKKYKNLGLGTLLKDHTRNIGYDYICGVMYKELNNKDHWSKRRKLVAENDDVYIMAEIF